MRNETDSQLVKSPASPALEVRELVKTFGGRRVVNGVSFELQRGEIFGFLGPNGSGKTTTMRMALDLIRPDSGSVALLGAMPTRRALRRVGYLPEERGLFRRARVIDVLRYLGRLKGLEANAAGRRAEEMLERVGLADSARTKVQGLSRGMTQLIQFSGALLHHPDLIILDEPFAGLDPLNVELMKEIIREEQARGASIIFSTHIMSEVEELCERVLLIDAGDDATLRVAHGAETIPRDPHRQDRRRPPARAGGRGDGADRGQRAVRIQSRVRLGASGDPPLVPGRPDFGGAFRGGAADAQRDLHRGGARCAKPRVKPELSSRRSCDAT